MFGRPVYPLSLLILLTVPLVLKAGDLYGDEVSYDPEKIFAVQGDVVLTQEEIDAEFSKVSPEYRRAFIRDGQRVNQMVATLLRTKIVAADARAASYDEDPVIRGRMSLAAETELAEAWIRKVMEDAPDADYELLAEEEYLAFPDEFMTEDIVDVSHILINNEKRSDEEALQLAQSLRARLIEDPSLFEELVMEYSEDPSKFSNAGQFPRVKRGEMVKEFEETSFSLETPGDISQPVPTRYGYHIIRLNEKFPSHVASFDVIKEEAMARAKEKYITTYRTRYIKGLVSDQIEIPDGAIENMAKRYFGEDLELAPTFEE